jgi:hypothetical protein
MGPPHLSLSPMRLCRNGRNAMFVILNPSPVILSEAKNLVKSITYRSFTSFRMTKRDFLRDHHKLENRDSSADASE